MGSRFRERGRWYWVWTTCLYNTYPQDLILYLNVLFIFKLLSVVPTQLYDWVSVLAPVTVTWCPKDRLPVSKGLAQCQELSYCSSVLQLTWLCSRNLRALKCSWVVAYCISLISTFFNQKRLQPWYRLDVTDQLAEQLALFRIAWILSLGPIWNQKPWA